MLGLRERRADDSEGFRLSRDALEARRLSWPGCLNVRDVGGLPLSSGGKTRSGALIRADCLDRLTAAGVSVVRACGVGRILDLRSVWELPAVPHPFHEDPAYRLIPFIDDDRDHERDRAVERTRADLYRGSVDRNVRQIAAAVAAIANAPRQPVVVHCLSGVDRTGMLVAIVLAVVGVDRAAIEADYAASELELGGTSSRSLSMPPAGAETIRELLEHIDQMHGGVRVYLERGGVTGDQLSALHERLI